MLYLTLFACLATLSLGRPAWHQLDHSYTFQQYAADFGKKYDGEELVAREAIFLANRDAAIAHNKRESTWKEGVNHLSDRTTEEFRSMLGYDKAVGFSLTEASRASTSDWAKSSQSLPASIDWRDKGAVTAVKDQGQCGSCWTFAAAEALESADFLHGSGLLRDLSPQQFASCTVNPKHCGGTGGCAGGTAEVAYATAVTDGGVATEWVYPYTSHGGSNSDCAALTASERVVNITSYTKLPSNQLEPLLDAIANVGPIAVSVDAGAWGRYESGVFDGCDASSPDIDHAVLAVGYGSDPSGGDYITIRNSWTPTWGENGYIRLAQGSSTPVCGTDTHPSDGSGCDDGPTSVTVCGTCGVLYDTCYPVVGK